jgi:hypothetical protein
MNTINGNFLERTIPSLKGALVTLNMGNSTSEMNLEDLATTLGVGSGGGTNPTSTYVPYNNEGTFEDSFIINDTANSVLKTYVGDDKGLYFDFANNAYKLGDFNTYNNGTCFIIDDGNTIIKTSNNATDKGLFLDFVNLQYKFGEFSLGNQINLLIDDSNKFASFYSGGNQNGLKLDFINNRLYSFGQLNGGNLTKLEIDDINQKLILSANLETASAGSGAAGKRLKITIGGNDYLIDLITP